MNARTAKLIRRYADEGQTWDADNQVMVWDAVAQEFLET